jgi:hypothetical protein
MTNRGVAVVGLRLLAIYIVIRLLFLLPRAVDHWTDSARPDAPIALVMVAGLGLAVFLWFRVGTLAAWILPARTAESLATGGGDGREAPTALLFPAAGVLLLAWSLPDLIVQTLLLYDAGVVESEQMTGFATAALRVLLGAGLMLGSAGLERAIHHLRRTGTG